MHGLLLIDKPKGLTSHDVVRRIRRICGTRKVGHAGTLDPMATGVLPVAINHGTKVLQFLLAAHKSYRAVFSLGVSTDTLDAEGEITDRRELPDDCEIRIPALREQFTGTIEQVPPIYSALKKDGVPLYKLARQGLSVEIEPRQVDIVRFEVLQIALPEVTVEIDCSKGTYIRSLCRDFGEALGCGAHLSGLRRLKSGPFHIDDCKTLEFLEENGVSEDSPWILSLDDALVEYPSVLVEPKAAERLGYGIPPELEETSCPVRLNEGDLVRLSSAQTLLAMARFVPAQRMKKRGDFKLVRVFQGA